MKLDLFKPLKTPITQIFGVNGTWYRSKGINIIGHNGIDYHAIDGQPIYACHDGIITFSGEDGSAGLGIVIRTNQEYDYKDGTAYYKSIYWHLKSFAKKAGEKVESGDIIGYANSTGLSTATHLHFGLKPIYQGEQDWQWLNLEQKNGYLGSIDPIPYFNNFYSEDVKKMLDMISMLKRIVELLKGRLIK